FFAAEGTCGKSDVGGFFWNVSNKNKEALERYAMVLSSAHARRFHFIEDKKGDYDSVWKLHATCPMDLVAIYRRLFYTASGKKRVPKEILNSPPETMRAFLRGYEQGDGHDRRNGQQVATTNSQTLAAGLLFMYRTVGRDFALMPQRADKPSIIHM